MEKKPQRLIWSMQNNMQGGHQTNTPKEKVDPTIQNGLSAYMSTTQCRLLPSFRRNGKWNYCCCNTCGLSLSHKRTNSRTHERTNAHTHTRTRWSSVKSLYAIIREKLSETIWHKADSWQMLQLTPCRLLQPSAAGNGNVWRVHRPATIEVIGH